jgi:hypothetical protein
MENDEILLLSFDTGLTATVTTEDFAEDDNNDGRERCVGRRRGEAGGKNRRKKSRRKRTLRWLLAKGCSVRQRREADGRGEEL